MYIPKINNLHVVLIYVSPNRVKGVLIFTLIISRNLYFLKLNVFSATTSKASEPKARLRVVYS